MMDDTSKADAADKAPRPDPNSEPKPRADKQDAPNYVDRADGDRAIETGDLNSANDE